MRSDGPYIVTEEKHFYKTVNTPLGDKFELGTDELACALNLAYAEGRKSMEKDFKEILEMANKMRGQGNLDGVFDEFDAWKKARGIE